MATTAYSWVIKNLMNISPIHLFILFTIFFYYPFISEGSVGCYSFIPDTGNAFFFHDQYLFYLSS